MRTFKLVVSYDGTDYCGWQIQPNGLSIQQEIRDAVHRVTGEDVAPIASGRTDAGVHALAQVASLRLEKNIEPEALQRALNANLPEQIVIRSVEYADDSFDAVRHAKWKHYRYVFHDGPLDDVFLRRYCWKVRTRLDENRMNEAAGHLLGTHDFRCFETKWPNRASSVRTIRDCRVTRLGDLVYLDVESNGFLYNMVRAIAGSLYEVGRGRWSAEELAAVLQSGNRSLAGPNVPARGLFLVRVIY